MKNLIQSSKSIGTGVLASMLLLLASFSGTAEILTNVFTGTITLDGDISDFFDGAGALKTGVCVTNDPAGAILGVPGSEGLDENPLSGLTTKDSLRHPSGFNQRRIMSAYNPALNGGTIFVGVDLPGGTDSIVNPNYSDGVVPVRLGSDGIIAIRPFDADGNGEPETIGYNGVTPLRRCSDAGVSLLTTDVIDCSKPGSGGFTDAVNISLDPGNRERYAVTVIFGNNVQAQVELFENFSTPAGTAALSVGSIPGGKTFGAVANRNGANVVLGFDVEFMITNVNANVDECSRMIQTISVNSGSLQDGSPNGEDFNQLRCIYELPASLKVTKQCPPTNAAPGTQLVFTGTVTNTGQVTLTNVTVVNDQPTNNAPVFGPVTLAPGAGMSFMGSYPVPTNVCSITDTLTAQGIQCAYIIVSNAPVLTNFLITATTNATCTVSNTPRLQLTKSCPPTNAVPGSLLAFTGTITNTGNISITNITLGDIVLGATNPVTPTIIARLDPGQGTNITGSFLVPANYAADSITNTITASGRDLCGTAVDGMVTTNCPIVRLACLGDYVWEDLNRDGIQTNEVNTGLSNIVVHLIDCGNSNVVRTTNTDVNGFYLFCDLVPGSYRVQAVVPMGYQVTLSNAANDCIDSDANAMGLTDCVMLAPGETNLCLDIGLFRPAAIGDFVWHDLNTNGVQDAMEPGVSNVLVKLMDCAGNVLRTTNTDVNGLYLFANLMPTNYNIMFNLPAGWVFTGQDKGGDDAKDSDANPANGMTTCYTLISGQTNRTVDAGLFRLVCIGDFVWEDLNGDGIQDMGEPGITNVTVRAYDCATSNLVSTTLTVSNGFYQFCDLLPGSYQVQVVFPGGYTNTIPNVGTNDCVDSDANAQGFTDCVFVPSGTTNFCFDIGLKRPAAIGDFVWHDLNTNGVQDVGEPGVPNVLVKLMDCAGNVLRTTNTDVNGLYLFANLMPTNYNIMFNLPPGWVFTSQNIGADDKDSDANPANGMTTCYTLISGQTNRTVDAGLIQLQPRICVTKEIACLLPGDQCDVFGKVATGYKSDTQDPAFCYRIVVSNCGQVTLTNVTVTDNKLAGVGAAFPPVLAPGQSVTNVFKMSWNTDTTNTVTASGRSDVTGELVTTNDYAVAQVDQARITCQLILSSPDDQDGNPLDGHVQLPSDNNPHPVTLTRIICNTGEADLANVTLSGPVFCANLAPFKLAAGACVTNVCTTTLSCDDAPLGITNLVTAQVDTATNRCGYDFNGNNITVQSSCQARVDCQPENPCLLIFKSPDKPTAEPFSHVIYTYTVTNCGGITLSNLVVTDDNGTPDVPGDDFIVGTIDIFPPGATTNFTYDAILPVTICSDGSSTPSGMIIIQVLPDGNIKASFVQAFDVNDNTYGVNSYGWGGPNGHKFSNLTGSDKVVWEFRNGAGQVALRFAEDYISAGAATPSGYGTLGFGGDGDAPEVGNAAHVLGFDTSLTENLNKVPFLNHLAQYTVDSPASNDVNAVFWEYRMIYTVVLDKNAFGASGFGSAAIIDQHNSPGKRKVENPQPCGGCVTNVATVTAEAGNTVLTNLASATVCSATCAPCGPCEGKVTQLTLQYNGVVPDAHIQVVQKNGATVFDGIVQPGQPFSFSGTDNGTLGTDINLFVNGVLNASIHTSCSQPIGPGLVRGDFIILDGSSKLGGKLCLLARCPEKYSYWKKNTDNWPAAYSPDQTVVSVFVKAALYPDAAFKTLLEAVGGHAGSGKVKDLLKQAVTAVLNAASSQLSYPFSTMDVIDAVNMALMTGTDQALKDLTALLKQANENKDCQPSPGAPGLTVTKHCESGLPGGQLVSFSGTVSNSGNVTLTEVTVVNDQPTNNTPVLGPITLAPGQSVAFAGSYTPDADPCGPFEDTVKAQGVDYCGNIVSAMATASCPGSQSRLVVVKDCQSATAFGLPITFSGFVSNAGVVTVTNIVVEDDQAGPLPTIPLLAPGQAVGYAGQYIPNGCGSNFTDIVTATGRDTCGNLVSDSDSATCSVPCPPPGLTLMKNADKSTVSPGGLVTYVYTVKNTGSVPLSNVVVTDDNGTPGFPGDDFVVGTIPSLGIGQMVDLTKTLILPVTICDEGSSVPSGMIIVQVLPGGNIKASFIQAFDVNDNTYGVNSIGWGGKTHTFGNLTGSDKAVWEFRNGAGQVVLRFAEDYISAGAPTPSGYGTLGFGGDGDAPDVGSAAHVLGFDTSLTENLNKAPFLNNLGQYTVNSPALADPNSGLWEYRMIYTVIVDKAAFGPSGYGSAAIIDQHNSPGKRSVENPQPCGGCVTNIATATAGNIPLSVTASAVVCSTNPPAGGGQCPHNYSYWKKNKASWPAPYSSGQTVVSVFAKASLYPNAASKTLLEAVDGKAGSGKVKDLLKQGVTALLNAASPGISYPFTTNDVIAAVNMALMTGTDQALKELTTLLKEANENKDCEQPPGGGENCDTDGKPNVLTLSYNGNSCSEATNSQMAISGKTSCSGDPQNAPVVRVVASDRATPPAANSAKFFDGLVTLNGPTFEVKAANAGDDRFGANTYFHIYNGNTLVQTIQIHTSCSAPLRRGETFGSLVLVDYRIDP